MIIDINQIRTVNLMSSIVEIIMIEERRKNKHQKFDYTHNN